MPKTRTNGAAMQASETIKDIRHSLHELAQPLAAVTGLIDLLLLEGQPETPLYEEIQLISEKLEQVLEIIAHIRNLARTASQQYGEEMAGIEGGSSPL
jgi:signal transduction histidine kinase